MFLIWSNYHGGTELIFRLRKEKCDINIEQKGVFKDLQVFTEEQGELIVILCQQHTDCAHSGFCHYGKNDVEILLNCFSTQRDLFKKDCLLVAFLKSWRSKYVFLSNY